MLLYLFGFYRGYLLGNTFSSLQPANSREHIWGVAFIKKALPSLSSSLQMFHSNTTQYPGISTSTLPDLGSLLARTLPNSAVL